MPGYSPICGILCNRGAKQVREGQEQFPWGRLFAGISPSCGCCVPTQTRNRRNTQIRAGICAACAAPSILASHGRYAHCKIRYFSSGSCRTMRIASGSRFGPAWEVLLIFTKLGFTCFGGPIAHIGYFRTEFVSRRHWLGEHAYADLVGLCQFTARACIQQARLFLGTAARGICRRPGLPGLGLPFLPRWRCSYSPMVRRRSPGPSSAAACCTACNFWRWRWWRRPFLVWREVCVRIARALIAVAALAAALMAPTGAAQIAAIIIGATAGGLDLP